MLSFYLLFLMFISTDVHCQDLIRVKTEEFSLEDSTITMSYNISRSGTVYGADYFYWYRQYNGKSPEFLVVIAGSETNTTSQIQPRFSTKLSEAKTHVDLEISSAELADSALYYCAVRPDSDDKLVFGAGTRLHVYPKDVEDPAFYELKSNDDETAACLATGFTQHNATDEIDGFKQTVEAVRESGDPEYSRVILGRCPVTVPVRKKCGDDEGDAKMRFLSVTVLWLRLLFIKTIIFNGLMTLRVWMS